MKHIAAKNLAESQAASLSFEITDIKEVIFFFGSNESQRHYNTIGEGESNLRPNVLRTSIPILKDSQQDFAQNIFQIKNFCKKNNRSNRRNMKKTSKLQ